MKAKQQSSSLHAHAHAHALLRRPRTHALLSPLLLLLVAAAVVVSSDIGAGVSLTAHALSTYTTTTTTITRSRTLVDRSLSIVSSTATRSSTAAGSISDASADTTSPTEPAIEPATEPTDDCMAASSSSSQQDLDFLEPTPADLELRNWCKNTAGIALSPSIQICTTARSVAGRGLFATRDVEKGDVLALIPREVVFGAENCRRHLLDTDATSTSISTTKNKRGRTRRWMKNMLSKLAFYRRENSTLEVITNESTMWAPILTKYALKAKASNHPWWEWIDQWNREDPMHEAYMQMSSILKIASKSSSSSNSSSRNQQDDLPEYQMMMEELICSTATKIQRMMPHLNEKHLQAAVSIRLSRLDQHFRSLGLVEDDSIDLDQALRLYSLITSRAIELDSDTTAVLPLYDLANHSLKPNLGLEYVENDGNDGNGGNDGNENGVDSSGFYSIFARRDITAGSELFFRYTKFDEAMDDNAALWAAINWGIPHVPSQYETEE